MLSFNLLGLNEGINPLEIKLSGELPLFRQLDVDLAGTGTLSGTIDKRDDNLYLLHLSLLVPVYFACRRCLETFVEEVRSDFTVVAMRRGSRDDEGFGEEDVILLEPKQNELHLEEYAREFLLLNLPSFPLCREDCRGICAGCGADLNKDNCSCVG
ncbi:MAG: hypothetical protein A2Z06_00955 [Candidatus Glassbacteria bacterium RBG_16_58_8]|uniref:DUF177 domain-containing protein n=1 Tax=Candidatus Glassbacteria bacterium RBG_16_58_8 TaxID=1817866 RepID=A0A1F5YCI2_9BACT|nr:MAG: hypothetical protein A2Z06_00955 [Candidatus Glassbacteria bacterium RBG_16_58_8]